jgi:hypothetical protein
MTLGTRKTLILINCACVLVASVAIIAGLLSWCRHQRWAEPLLFVCTLINVFIILRYHARENIHDHWAKDDSVSISSK